MIAIVDAGPLYASSDLNDDDHDQSIAVLAQPDLHLVIPALVIAEVTYFVGRYSNLPLGGTDASVIALAERLGGNLIITLDRRHFGIVRHRSGATFQLLP